MQVHSIVPASSCTRGVVAVFSDENVNLKLHVSCIIHLLCM